MVIEEGMEMVDDTQGPMKGDVVEEEEEEEVRVEIVEEFDDSPEEEVAEAEEEAVQKNPACLCCGRELVVVTKRGGIFIECCICRGKKEGEVRLFVSPVSFTGMPKHGYIAWNGRVLFLSDENGKRIDGGSLLQISDDGRIVLHRGILEAGIVPLDTLKRMEMRNL